jgi:hypothetical protein
LAVAAALAAAGLLYRQKLVAAALAITGAAYLPWAAVLAQGVMRAAHKSVYALTGSGVHELPVQAGYAFAGLFLGEAYIPVTFALAIATGAFLLWALARGWLSEASTTRLLLGAATVIGFIGAAKWVSFPFLPARLLWLLPWLIPLVIAGANGKTWGRAGLAAWLALMTAGQALYVQQTGFLNKGYLIPFEGIAAQASEGLVLADATNCDPSPLRAALSGERFFAIANEQDAKTALAATRDATVVWRVRAARDVTPQHIQNAVDLALDQAGFQASVSRLLPYSALDRFLLRVAGDPDPPTHHLLVLELRRPMRDTR